MKLFATTAGFGSCSAARISAQPRPTLSGVAGRPSTPCGPWWSAALRAAVTRATVARLLGLVCAIILAGSGSTRAVAGDVKAGRAKALMCQTCHGLDGLSKVPDAPNIAGQTEPYIVTQLQAFKSGARQNDTMALIAGQLSDDDVANLAAYFSAIEITIGKIPGE